MAASHMSEDALGCAGQTGRVDEHRFECERGMPRMRWRVVAAWTIRSDIVPTSDSVGRLADVGATEKRHQAAAKGCSWAVRRRSSARSAACCSA